MELVFMKETMPKLLNQIPSPVIFGIFMLILLGVLAIIFKKVYDLRGE